jgi:hypothetical protein
VEVSARLAPPQPTQIQLPPPVPESDPTVSAAAAYAQFLHRFVKAPNRIEILEKQIVLWPNLMPLSGLFSDLVRRPVFIRV